MISKESAFRAGISRRCKQANFDVEDEEQIARLLLMPSKEAAPIVRQMVMAKVANGLSYEGTHRDANAWERDLFPSSRPQTNPEAAGGNAVPPPPEPDLRGPKPLPSESVAEGATASDGRPPAPPMSIDTSDQPQDPQGPITLDPGRVEQLQAQGGQPAGQPPGQPPYAITADRVQKLQQPAGNVQNEAIEGGLGGMITPEMKAEGFTPEKMRQMQEMAINTSMNRTAMRGFQQSMGRDFRPIPGGLRAGDINASEAQSPLRQGAWSFIRKQLADREAGERVAGGQRKGWSTMGSGLGSSAVSAGRGRPATPVSPPASGGPMEGSVTGAGSGAPDVATEGAAQTLSNEPTGTPSATPQTTLQQVDGGLVGSGTTAQGKKYTMRGTMGGGPLPSMPAPPEPESTTMTSPAPSVSTPTEGVDGSPATSTASPTEPNPPTSMNFKPRATRRTNIA